MLSYVRQHCVMQYGVLYSSAPSCVATACSAVICNIMQCYATCVGSMCDMLCLMCRWVGASGCTTHINVLYSGASKFKTRHTCSRQQHKQTHKILVRDSSSLSPKYRTPGFVMHPDAPTNLCLGTSNSVLHQSNTFHRAPCHAISQIIRQQVTLHCTASCYATLHCIAKYGTAYQSGSTTNLGLL